MNYEKAKITVILKYFSDLLRLMSERTRKFTVARCFSQWNQLFCLKLFCQIRLICAPISMGRSEKNENHTQWALVL